MSLRWPSAVLSKPSAATSLNVISEGLPSHEHRLGIETDDVVYRNGACVECRRAGEFYGVVAAGVLQNAKREVRDGSRYDIELEDFLSVANPRRIADASFVVPIADVIGADDIVDVIYYESEEAGTRSFIVPEIGADVLSA